MKLVLTSFYFGSICTATLHSLSTTCFAFGNSLPYHRHQKKAAVNMDAAEFLRKLHRSEALLFLAAFNNYHDWKSSHGKENTEQSG